MNQLGTAEMMVNQLWVLFGKHILFITNAELSLTPKEGEKCLAQRRSERFAENFGRMIFFSSTALFFEAPYVAKILLSRLLTFLR